MGEPRYRVGRKLGRTVYEGDTLIGVMDTPELGTLAVDALNAYDHVTRRQLTYFFPDGHCRRLILNDDLIPVGFMDTAELALRVVRALDLWVEAH